MCPIKIDEIRIDHIVDFSKDHTTFAAARENGNGHLRIFLINDVTGTIYTRNGRADSWEELVGSACELIRVKIIEARDCVPIYKVNGTYNN
ncbi:MAG: hypothetical protein KKH57_06605 [Candidatus Omnitrophica bacterium]|nr:hypothetical protein [Candidatus Omnitrophota bacterium]